MSVTNDLANVFRRDLRRLREELEAFPDDAALWRVVPGIPNAAGNLALHLEGNLREYIGRQLGGVAYTRQRPLEFSTTGLPAAELIARARALEELIPPIVEGLSAEALAADFPEPVLGEPLPVLHFLIHLHGHLTFHRGQMNCLRRFER